MKAGLWRIWDGWKWIAAKIAHVQGNLLLSVIYFVVVAPLAFFFRLFQDPLSVIRKKQSSYWTPRPPLGDVDKFLKREY